MRVLRPPARTKPWMGSFVSSTDVHHAARRLQKPWLANMVTRFFLLDNTPDE
jgi:hypothetical protein